MDSLKCLVVLCLIVGVESHASCSIQWSFGKSCESVNTDIVNQMKKWSGACQPGVGEKCLYEIKSNTTDKVTGTHKTPVKHYIDDLSFTFKSSGANCAVDGYSTSEVWYAILDYGTNYCNLHNLITGSGLDKTPGYKEDTNDSQCTQYSSANCTKY